MFVSFCCVQYGALFVQGVEYFLMNFLQANCSWILIAGLSFSLGEVYFVSTIDSLDFG